MINITCIWTLRKQNNKGEKQSESLPDYFSGIYIIKNIISNRRIFKNIEIEQNDQIITTSHISFFIIVLMMNK